LAQDTKVLFTAKDGFSYNRTHILAQGLETLEQAPQFYKIPERSAQYGAVLRELSLEADLVYVPPFRHRDLSFIRKYAQAPVIFDPLISRYLTKVVDYGHYWKAPQKWLIDYRDFRNCDLLLADTQLHLDYFKKKFFLPSSLASAVLPIGVDLDNYQASFPKSTGPLKVGFYGSFVPLQGVLKIIEALALIKEEKDLEFTIIGTGYQYKEARQLASRKGLNDSIFKGWVNYDDLATELSRIDLGLGVFGNSLKTDLVVPNKLYHYAALGKGILTKNSPGAQEVFQDRETMGTSSTKPIDIAEKILYYRDNRMELIRIARNARQLMEDQYSHAAIAQKFLSFQKLL